MTVAWVPDRNHQLTDPEPLGVAERGSRQAAARKSQERKVGIRILARDPGLNAGAVGEYGIQPRRAAHHMVIGQHVAVGRDDHTRAGPPRGRKRIVGIVPAPAPADAHHRRPGALCDMDDGTGESVEQCRVVSLRRVCRFWRLLTS